MLLFKRLIVLKLKKNAQETRFKKKSTPYCENEISENPANSLLFIIVLFSSITKKYFDKKKVRSRLLQNTFT